MQGNIKSLGHSGFSVHGRFVSPGVSTQRPCFCVSCVWLLNGAGTELQTESPLLLTNTKL